MSWSIPLFAGGVFGTLSTLMPVGDPDLFWHLAQGRQTLTEGLARVERFSWSVPGAPVLTDQWFGQVVWYEAYATFGWHGVVALRALLVAAIVTLVVGSALMTQRRPFIAVLASVPAIALSRFSWTERPQLLGLLCFTTLLLLIRAADARPRLYLALPVLIALWANLHASFVLGLAIGALAGADLAWRSAPGPRRIVALALVASVAATLLTPSGSAIWTSAGGHFLSPPRIVLEEGVPDVTQSYGVIFVTIILAVLGTAVLSRPVALRDAAVLVPVLFVSLTAARHTPFFAVAATPYLAEHGPMALGEIARMLRVRPRLPALKTAVPALGVDLATGVVVVAALFAGTGLAHAEPQLDAYPAGALASLPSGPGLLNDYDWGGFLIWYAPATPVFIDGRLFPYTGEALRDYETVVDLGPTWRDVLARRGVRALLVKPGAPVAVRARDLGWQIVSEGERFVLFAVPNLR